MSTAKPHAIQSAEEDDDLELVVDSDEDDDIINNDEKHSISQSRFGYNNSSNVPQSMVSFNFNFNFTGKKVMK